MVTSINWDWLLTWFNLLLLYCNNFDCNSLSEVLHLYSVVSLFLEAVSFEFTRIGFILCSLFVLTKLLYFEDRVSWAYYSLNCESTLSMFVFPKCLLLLLGWLDDFLLSLLEKLSYLKPILPRFTEEFIFLKQELAYEV